MADGHFLARSFAGYIARWWAMEASRYGIVSLKAAFSRTGTPPNQETPPVKSSVPHFNLKTLKNRTAADSTTVKNKKPTDGWSNGV